MRSKDKEIDELRNEIDIIRDNYSKSKPSVILNFILLPYNIIIILYNYYIISLLLLYYISIITILYHYYIIF